MVVPTVLVISDQTDVNGFVHTALGREGFTVLTFDDTTEGMKKVYETLPDVLLMEDRLSVTDSIDFCFQTRQLSCIRIILLGDGAMDSSLVNGLQRGADFYMRRPISVGELVARVKSLLRRQDGSLQSVRRFLNVEERSVLLDGRSIKLTPTEFRLLAYMMLSRERVIRIKELISKIWPGQQVTEDSVRFYISRLRHKLDSDSPQLILNRRGVGYRLAYRTEMISVLHSQEKALTGPLCPGSSREVQ